MSELDKKIPRLADNYSAEAVALRQRFITEKTGVKLKHIAHSSQDLESLMGNIENPIGVAQVPIGLAGPVRINGEHAQGDFYIPMATTEGTLVASYSRGMRVLSEIGGVKTTVIERYMQRAPVFHFDDARDAREFGTWLDDNLATIREVAESTTSIGKLSHLEQYGVSRMRFVRFNYTTGDAAGQNMVGKATLAACNWIADNHPKLNRYTLSGAIDTDKKHSQLNTLHSRGTRVVAEAVLSREVALRLLHVDTKALFDQRQVNNVGGMLAGTSNNGAHSANGLAAIFIATGQDAANIAESQAAIVYADLMENGDLYWSITLPSVIVASYGGGTGLGSQRECLEMLGCYGDGKALKLAEICAATVLAGEMSLGAAVLAGDWVSSHDQLGRNRP
jgi:hydroxymethylglutaryl-CoA reductase (NADPH)